jgi:RNA polymerase sigma-70 factor (ECF subfamily)
MSKVLLTDEELWEDIRAGNCRAFAQFYDRYWLRLYKAACYYLKDKELCEEIVQEVFVSIWKKRDSLNIRNFSQYLNSCTRYEVYRKMKTVKLSITQAIDAEVEDLARFGIENNKGDDRLTEIDNYSILNECLTALPKRSKEIFYMSKFSQLSNAEIAEQLGISKHTVENQLAIALRHVRVNFHKIALLIVLVSGWK